MEYTHLLVIHERGDEENPSLQRFFDSLPAETRERYSAGGSVTRFDARAYMLSRATLAYDLEARLKQCRIMQTPAWADPKTEYFVPRPGCAVVPIADQLSIRIAVLGNMKIVSAHKRTGSIDEIVSAYRTFAKQDPARILFESLRAYPAFKELALRGRGVSVKPTYIAYALEVPQPRACIDFYGWKGPYKGTLARLEKAERR